MVTAFDVFYMSFISRKQHRAVRGHFFWGILTARDKKLFRKSAETNWKISQEPFGKSAETNWKIRRKKLNNLKNQLKLTRKSATTKNNSENQLKLTAKSAKKSFGKSAETNWKIRQLPQPYFFFLQRSQNALQCPMRRWDDEDV